MLRKTRVDETDIRKFLAAFKGGEITLEHAIARLRQLPFEDLGFAKIDHHRSLRQGFPEVIYARGKTAEQVAEITSGMLRANASHNILITRAGPDIFASVKRLLAAMARRDSGSRRRKKSAQAEFHDLSRTILIRRSSTIRGKGLILVVSAGTSDISVAEEAMITARAMGNRAEEIYDVGVAGLHRLLAHRTALAEARVIICVAGMEGALPSVVAGMVAAPVIAVPTSTGYGSSFGGLTALLAMLNSCASNVSVVNIDNGFGAGCVASAINAL
ncbi:MAG TPA: nickel pincer cofactor biosynthesis protein LarB [Candidatus Acidoferrales bacterium]|nr:nickel pincer cofactor biosynthesis protein LarB [Candidatus Acidoferrales bacterium]